MRKNEKSEVRRLSIKQKMMREKDNGITLVALVITVIIIIILATVTLNFTFRRGRNNNESKPSKIYDTIFSISRRIRAI